VIATKKKVAVERVAVQTSVIWPVFQACRLKSEIINVMCITAS
jgi:hypothetical protein